MTASPPQTPPCVNGPVVRHMVMLWDLPPERRDVRQRQRPYARDTLCRPPQMLARLGDEFSTEVAHHQLHTCIRELTALWRRGARLSLRSKIALDWSMHMACTEGGLPIPRDLAIDVIGGLPAFYCYSKVTRMAQLHVEPIDVLVAVRDGLQAHASAFNVCGNLSALHLYRELLERVPTSEASERMWKDIAGDIAELASSPDPDIAQHALTARKSLARLRHQPPTSPIKTTDTDY